MRRWSFLWVLAGAAFLMLPLSASASAIYAYTGPSFTFAIDAPVPTGTFTTSMSVSGSFEVAAPLGANLALADISGSVLSYSFTDGRTVYTDGNSSITSFSIETDGAGAISDWIISAGIGVPVLLDGDQQMSFGTQYSSDFGNLSECLTDNGSTCLTTGADNGLVNSPGAGNWALVPEPSTSALLALGIIGLAAHRRRAAA